jgi:aerobic carbon-monoxide dehydrogenase medium subunit
LAAGPEKAAAVGLTAAATGLVTGDAATGEAATGDAAVDAAADALGEPAGLGAALGAAAAGVVGAAVGAAAGGADAGAQAVRTARAATIPSQERTRMELRICGPTHTLVRVPEAIAFVQPGSLDEAVEALEAYGEDAKIVAGATALSIMLRQRLIRPRALVSIAGLTGMDSIDHLDGELRIGGLATHRQVELSPIVRSAVPVLAQTFGVVANVRVRNAATVGGVLAEADYASDPPAVFMALDAEIEAFGPNGPRAIAVQDFFRGFFETALETNEIVTGIRIPIPAAGTHGAYTKYVTRSTEDRPCVGVAALVRMSTDGSVCEDLRIAVGAAAETPQRFPEVEAFARGTPLDDEVARAIADGYAERIDTLADMRGSAWYRTEMIRVWVRRAIERARS